MASEPSGPEQNKPAVKQQRGWWITAGLLALLLVAGLVVLWVQAPALYGRGDAAKTAAATTRGAILTVAAALIAATAAGAALLATRWVTELVALANAASKANKMLIPPSADRRNRHA